MPAAGSICVDHLESPAPTRRSWLGIPDSIPYFFLVPTRGHLLKAHITIEYLVEYPLYTFVYNYRLSQDAPLLAPRFTFSHDMRTEICTL
jgi:hypothetical protein